MHPISIPDKWFQDRAQPRQSPSGCGPPTGRHAGRGACGPTRVRGGTATSPNRLPGLRSSSRWWSNKGTASACLRVYPYGKALNAVSDAAVVVMIASALRTRVARRRRHPSNRVQPARPRRRGPDHPPRCRPVEPDSRPERGLSGSTKARRSKPARSRRPGRATEATRGNPGVRFDGTGGAGAVGQPPEAGHKAARPGDRV
jgi:hypothetical protein